MAEEKSVSVSFRVTPRFKRLLQTAAEREHRSQTNLLENCSFRTLQTTVWGEGGGETIARQQG
jgi:hypothetical protein